MFDLQALRTVRHQSSLAACSLYQAAFMSIEPQRICVVGGAGHVGLPFSMVLADCGFRVDILDKNAAALALIHSGKMPFLEAGGDEFLARVLKTDRLQMTSDAAIVREADVVVCVIGTPVDEYLNPATMLFYQVIDEMRPFLRDGQTLILRSTVYPGLSSRINRMFRENGPDVRVCFCPERVAKVKACAKSANCRRSSAALTNKAWRRRDRYSNAFHAK